MRLIILLGAATAALALLLQPRTGALVAGSICVSAGPYSVLGQPVVPPILECLPIG